MTQVPDEPPPFFGTWNRLYFAVVLYLAVIVLLFYSFARTYNR